MEIFLSIIICFLAVYGVFRLIYAITLFLLDSKKFEPKSSHRLIAVNDHSSNIEGYLRALAIREEGENIIILDHTKSDEMQQILQILEGEFGFITVMDNAQYIDYINSL